MPKRNPIEQRSPSYTALRNIIVSSGIKLTDNIATAITKVMELKSGNSVSVIINKKWINFQFSSDTQSRRKMRNLNNPFTIMDINKHPYNTSIIVFGEPIELRRK